MAFDFGKTKPAGTKRPTFIKKAASVPDPLAGIEYTDDLESDSRAELDALAQGFRERRDTEAARFADATDSEYWFAVCFRTRGDKDAFLSGIQASRIGDKYLDGHKLAKILGVTLPE